MRVWVGHFKGNPEQWFVVWAPNKHEAFLQIDPIVGEPDMQSFKELHSAGFVDFAVHFKDKRKLGDMQFLPPTEDVKRGYWLVFGSDDDVEDYVQNRIKKK